MSLESRLTEVDLVGGQNPNWKPLRYWIGTNVLRAVPFKKLSWPLKKHVIAEIIGYYWRAMWR